MNMYKCDICGRESFKKIRMCGYTLCSKHMHQFHKYGKFLDNIPRTNNDLNDYVINRQNNTAIFSLYNQKNVKIGEFIIDIDDLQKVKYHKWRLSYCKKNPNCSHVITGLPYNKTQKDLSWVILNYIPDNSKNECIDHINNNPLDNRKSNLRICTQGENTLNKGFVSNNTIGFIGISFCNKCNRYDPEIRLKYKRCHLGYCKTLEEAVYKRWYAKQLLFKEFSNETNNEKEMEFTKNLSQDIKKQLEKIVEDKLRAKNLWQ